SVLLIGVPVILLAAPYVAYLSIQTGRLRLEGKSFMNYTIGRRMAQGMGLSEASYGISPDLTEEGPFLSPNRFVVETSSSPFSLSALTRDWVGSASRNRKAFKDWFFYPAFGSIFMIGLTVVGLLRRPWDQRRLISESILLAVVGVQIIILLGMP